MMEVGTMFAVHTIDSLYYNYPTFTFESHAEAFRFGTRLGGWFDIERIL